jgi:hypothetical protein
VIAPSDPSHLDVIVAALGASAALGGLMLVFLGLLINTYQSFPGDSAAKVMKERTHDATWGIFAIFAWSLISVGLAAFWLVVPGGDLLYWITVVVFLSDLVAMAIGAAYSTKKLVK